MFHCSSIGSERFIGVIWDLIGDGFLSAGQQCDFVASFDELTGEIDTDETGSAQHEDLLGGNGRRHGGGGACRFCGG